ncbi:helix-turn-helix domain-containing protein [Gallaecimonas mangrovi]|uniref:helix-turn-helix domain-containing protein n=1 Tax=Gallaecimonas mangrovi TaxID=2291597 RepID=UPI000E207CD7|nr:AraC family transcriptional regulator [Gallaecimonas mangrovi]
MKPLPSTALSGFSARRPCQALVAYVQCFWWWQTGDEVPTQLLHPDGARGLLFNFGAPLLANGQPLPQAALCSTPVLTSTQLAVTGRTKVFGVRFLPGVGGLFLGDNLSAFSGVGIAASTLATHQALAWQLAEPWAQQQAVMEAWLLNALSSGTPITPPVQHMLAAIHRQQGQGSIGALSRDIGLSLRQTERQFKRQVGLGAKQYSRLCRVAVARQQLKAGALATSVAMANGYSDQAHFIHDFKAVTGLTPGNYLANVRARQRI